MKTQNLSQTTWFTILMLFVFFPVGIYLIWKNKKFKHNSRVIIATFFLAGCIISFTGCDTDTQTSIPNELTQVDETQTESKTLALTDNEKKNTYVTNGESFQYEGKSYKIIEVDGGDLSGNREPNVAVDIGFGDREYWALTNEYGQLVYVMADKIVLQDDENEPVLLREGITLTKQRYQEWKEPILTKGILLLTRLVEYLTLIILHHKTAH